MASNWGLILLLVGVAAMVVGPIMMMQPNAAQRYQGDLRMRAAKLGLRVKIVSLPRQVTDTTQPDSISMYCLPLEQPAAGVSTWLLLRAAYAHEAHFAGHWVWKEKAQVSPPQRDWLEQHLPRLPRSVAAIGNGPEGICIYWSEAGGEKLLIELAELLRSFPQTTA